MVTPVLFKGEHVRLRSEHQRRTVLVSSQQRVLSLKQLRDLIFDIYN